MKSLHYFNLLGVAALAALCVMQWRMNRELNLAFNRLEKSHFEQLATSKDQDKRLKGLSVDLDDFRKRFQEADGEAKETHRKLTLADRQIHQLTLDRDALKQSVTNWAAAVAQRDDRIREANARVNELAGQLNESVLKFNELATNYSASIKRYEGLVTNYNAVVGQLNASRKELAELMAANAAAKTNEKK